MADFVVGVRGGQRDAEARCPEWNGRRTNRANIEATDVGIATHIETLERRRHLSGIAGDEGRLQPHSEAQNIVILGGLKQAQVTALVVIALTLPVIAYLLRKERLNPPREEQAAATPTSTATEVAG